VLCTHAFLVCSSARYRIFVVAKTSKTLEQLLKVIEQGWDTSYIPNDLNPYYNVRDDLSIQNGIIFKGDRCVIPKTSFEVVLERETTVSCTIFLVVCDHYARRFSFRMCIGGIFPCQKLLQVVLFLFVHQDEAFKKLKEAVTKAPVLKYFDSKMDTTLQCNTNAKRPADCIC
jgi:hypothetical protein